MVRCGNFCIDILRFPNIAWFSDWFIQMGIAKLFVVILLTHVECFGLVSSCIYCRGIVLHKWFLDAARYTGAWTGFGAYFLFRNLLDFIVSILAILFLISQDVSSLWFTILLSFSWYSLLVSSKLLLSSHILLLFLEWMPSNLIFFSFLS